MRIGCILTFIVLVAGLSNGLDYTKRLDGDELVQLNAYVIPILL